MLMRAATGWQQVARAAQTAVLAAVALSAAFALVAPARAQVLESEPPKPIRGLEVQNRLGEQVPMYLQFKDEGGTLISLGKLFGRTNSKGVDKPVVVVMQYFRCPLLCPLVLQKLTQSLKQIDFTIGRDYDVVIVSFDPRDTPSDAAVHKAAALAEYDRPMTEELIGGLRLLTAPGDADTSRSLADALGFPYRSLPESGEYAHGSAVFVLTSKGIVSRQVLGLNYPPKDIRLALLDASQGRIGTLVDRVTLWCYHYDPNAGSYSLVAMRVMRIGAGITTVVLGVFLIAMFKLERIRRRRRLAGQMGGVGEVSGLVSGSTGSTAGSSAAATVPFSGMHR